MCTRELHDGWQIRNKGFRFCYSRGQCRRRKPIRCRRTSAAASRCIDLDDFATSSTAALVVDPKILVLDDALRSWRSVARSHGGENFPNVHRSTGDHCCAIQNLNCLCAAFSCVRDNEIDLARRDEVKRRGTVVDPNADACQCGWQWRRGGSDCCCYSPEASVSARNRARGNGCRCIKSGIVDNGNLRNLSKHCDGSRGHE